MKSKQTIQSQGRILRPDFQNLDGGHFPPSPARSHVKVVPEEGVRSLPAAHKRPKPVMRLPKVLPVGTRVLVNCLHADIVEVALNVVQYNADDPNECWVNPLRSPLYTVELHYDEQYDWHTRQIYIPVGIKRLKLFADEFRVVALPVQMGRPSRALPPDELYEGVINESIRYYRLVS